MANTRRYCLDTNVFIEGWNKYYSMDLSPGYWDILDTLAKENRLFAPIDVKHEIIKVDDNLTAWIKPRPYLFKEITDEVQAFLRQIMADHQRLVDSTKQRSEADPWVIAFAMAEKAVVVTKETPAGANSRRIKIPDVCNAYKIKWIDDFQLARELGIHFDAQLK